MNPTVGRKVEKKIQNLIIIIIIMSRHQQDIPDPLPPPFSIGYHFQ